MPAQNSTRRIAHESYSQKIPFRGLQKTSLPPGERIDLPDKEAKRLIAKDVVKSLKVGNGVIAKTPEALQ